MADTCEQKLAEGLRAADRALDYHRERLRPILDRLSSLPPDICESDDDDDDVESTGRSRPHRLDAAAAAPGGE